MVEGGRVFSPAHGIFPPGCRWRDIQLKASLPSYKHVKQRDAVWLTLLPIMLRGIKEWRLAQALPVQTQRSGI